MKKMREVIVKMMGHDKHHNCAMCKMAKSVGMMEKCTDKNCTDSSHIEEKKKGEEEKHVFSANK